VKSVKIFSPSHQQYGYLLYCKYVFNYDDVSFEKDINKSSNYLENNIIDIKFLETFSKSKINNKLNYMIFFWNGEKQYFENLKIINYLKTILEKNLNFFFVGNATQINGIKFAKLNKVEKKFKFRKINFRHYIAFQYPFLFSLVSIFKNIFKFLRYNNSQKICFTGLVKINDKLVSHLQKDWKFSNESIEILNELKKIYDLSNLNNKLIQNFNNFLISTKYKNFPIYEKYFMSQIIFRNCLSNILIKNKNFYLQDWDDRTKFMDSFFYKKFIFLDLGSTAGSDKVYFRQLVLKSFKKKFIRINFFDHFENFEFSKENIRMIEYLSKLNDTEIEKLNFDELIDALKID